MAGAHVPRRDDHIGRWRFGRRRSVCPRHLVQRVRHGSGAADQLWFPFLNFGAGGFFGCLGLSWATSKLDEKPALARVVRLALDWSGCRKEQEEAGNDKLLEGLSLLVGLAVLMLWIHFR